jgi:hypothetical protein
MLSAASLLERFEVFGRFYEAELDGRRYALRSHLEIVERGAGKAAPFDGDADLVAVMMNPGASRPVGNTKDDKGDWCETVPDRTQYQLMRLALEAQARGWPLRHIRVINLSDLRTPKSADLFAALANLRDPSHSLFCPARSAELAAALGQSSPVLRAWGMGAALLPWARRAVEATARRPVLGLTDDGLRYRHPLPQTMPMQQLWLARMTEQLSGPLAAA